VPFEARAKRRTEQWSRTPSFKGGWGGPSFTASSKSLHKNIAEKHLQALNAQFSTTRPSLITRQTRRAHHVKVRIVKERTRWAKEIRYRCILGKPSTPKVHAGEERALDSGTGPPREGGGGTTSKLVTGDWECLKTAVKLRAACPGGPPLIKEKAP